MYCSHATVTVRCAHFTETLCGNIIAFPYDLVKTMQSSSTSSTGTWNDDFDDIVLENMILEDILPDSDKEEDSRSNGEIRQTSTMNENRSGGLGNTSAPSIIQSTNYSVENDVLAKNIKFYSDKTINFVGYEEPYLIGNASTRKDDVNKRTLSEWNSDVPLWLELESPFHFSDILNQKEAVNKIEEVQQKFNSEMTFKHKFTDEFKKNTGLDYILQIVEHSDIPEDKIRDVKAVLTDINTFFMQAGLVNNQRILYSAAHICIDRLQKNNTEEITNTKNDILVEILSKIDYIFLQDGWLRHFYTALKSSPDNVKHIVNNIQSRKFEAVKPKYVQMMKDEKDYREEMNEEFKEKYGYDLSFQPVCGDVFGYCKDKWSIQADYMLIVGKYLETPKDYVNVTRVSKQYQNFIEMFRYNPIGNTDLFPNAQTIHFYQENEAITYVNSNPPGGYIAWFSTTGNRARDVKESLGERVEFKKDITSSNSTDMFRDDNGNMSLVFMNDVNTVMPYAFEDNNVINTVTFNESIAKLGKNSFARATNIRRIEFNDRNRISVIPDSCFYNINITRVVIPEGVTSIEQNAFHSCNHLTSVTLPNSLVSIGLLAFHSTAIRELEIPESVRIIQGHAFVNNNQLTSVTFIDNHDRGEVVVDGYAFSGCDNLNTININSRNILIEDTALVCITEGHHVTVNIDAHNAYVANITYCKAVMKTNNGHINLAKAEAQDILNHGNYHLKAVVALNVTTFETKELEVDDLNNEHFFKNN